MTKLLFYLVRELVHLAVQLCLMLVGLAVRLIFWTVQSYGWAKIAGFAAWIWAFWWLGGQGLAWLAWPLLGTLLLIPGVQPQRESRSPHRYFDPGWESPTPRPRRKWPWFGWRRKPPPIELPTDSEALPYLGTEPTSLEAPVSAELTNLQLLRQAWERVRTNGGSPGPDRVSVEWVGQNLPRFLEGLQRLLLQGRFRHGRPRFVEIPKGNGSFRRLAILNVVDRVYQQAVLFLVGPLLEALMAPCSYAYRADKGTRPALAEVERLLPSHPFVVDADIKSAFDYVRHDILFGQLAEAITDASLRSHMQQMVSACAFSAGLGVAQGAPSSPTSFNFYLTKTDWELLGKGYKVVRYADDLIILCATRAQAEEALGVLRRLLEAIGLELNREKTRIVHRDEGFDFLGYHFGPEGKRPSAKAIEGLKEKLEAAPDETKRRQILAGWQGYFGEPAANLGGITQAKTGGAMSTNELENYVRYFLGRANVFARYWVSQGRSGYVPVRQAPSQQDLLAHLKGEATLGTYLLEGDTTAALVFDIDGPDSTPAGQQNAFKVATRLVQSLEQQGITPLFFDSGGKGYHLWLCFGEKVKASPLREWASRWLDGFRPYAEGVQVEVFPKQNQVGLEALGSLIRLPLGLHPETRRPSQMVLATGQPIHNPLAELGQFVDHQRLLKVSSNPDTAKAPTEIAPLLKCGLIRSIVEKAHSENDLGHTERLALLYTLGKGGDAGASYIHQIMASCDDYNPQITQRWLGRLEAGHKSIRCATLKEWLKDYLPDARCECQPHPNPSPVDLLRPEAKYRSRPPQTRKAAPTTHWKDVAEEMFGDLAEPAKDREFEGWDLEDEPLEES